MILAYFLIKFYLYKGVSNVHAHLNAVAFNYALEFSITDEVRIVAPCFGN